MKKFWAFVGAFMLLFVAACGEVGETGPNEVAVHAEDGEFTAEQIKDCLPPSTRERMGMGDQFYYYPNDQRTWDFTGGDKSESGPIEVTDKDGVVLRVPGTLTFVLNTDCDVLKDFHQRIGIKHSAYGLDEGWTDALRLYIAQPLEKAIDQASQDYTWRQLLQDQSIRDEWETKVGELTRQFSASQSGGDKDYFCSPSYTGEGDCGSFNLEIQKPIPPESVSNALAETAAEVERNQQALAAQQRINTEAETLASLVAVLGQDGAISYQVQQQQLSILQNAITEGKVPIMPLPYGSNLNVNPQAPAE